MARKGTEQMCTDTELEENQSILLKFQVKTSFFNASARGQFSLVVTISVFSVPSSIIVHYSQTVWTGDFWGKKEHIASICIPLDTFAVLPF